MHIHIGGLLRGAEGASGALQPCAQVLVHQGSAVPVVLAGTIVQSHCNAYIAKPQYISIRMTAR